MTNPPQEPGAQGPHGQPSQSGPPDPHGTPPGGVPGQPAYGGGQRQPTGPHDRPGQPDQPAGSGQPVQGHDAPPQGQQPTGAPPAGFGQPGGYGPPPGRKRGALPWILAGGGALVVIAVVVVLVLALGDGDGGGSGSPRAVAEAFATSVNERKEPDRSIFCDSFAEEGRELAIGIPGGGEVPDYTLKATLGDVQESGDSAKAVVKFELASGDEVLKGDYNLDIKKEGGNWKICDGEIGNIEIPGLGG